MLPALNVPPFSSQCVMDLLATRKLFAVVEGTGDNRAVTGSYDDREEALAAFHTSNGGRMFSFRTEAERAEFIADPSSYVQNCEGPAKRVRNNDVPNRRVLLRETETIFLEKLCAGNYAAVAKLIQKYPAVLINGLNAPRRYEGANALQIAATYGFTSICEQILEAVGSDAYVARFEGGPTGMTYEMSAMLVEMYLNTPDRHTYETPIHMAVKNGHMDVVKLLMSYPECELKPNIKGLYPGDMVCRDAESKGCAEAIAAMLKKHFFVPVIRTAANVETPYVGEPFCRKNVPDLSNHPANNKFKYKRCIASFVGPMTEPKAQAFYQRWQNPSKMLVILHGFDEPDAEQKK